MKHSDLLGAWEGKKIDLHNQVEGCEFVVVNILRNGKKGKEKVNFFGLTIL